MFVLDLYQIIQTGYYLTKATIKILIIGGELLAIGYSLFKFSPHQP
jgi:hypothetical protein